MAIVNGNKTNLMQYIYTWNGTAFSANMNNTATFDYFANNFAVNDAIYFGSGLRQVTERCRGITLRIGTAIAATSYTLVWEYYDESNLAWTTLACTDNSASISLTGDREVTWTPPDDWSKKNVNGVTDYWIRARITAVNTPTEGGANATNKVVGHENGIIVNGGIDSGTATSGGASTLTNTVKTWGTTQHIGRAVRIHTGTGSGQVRWITSHTDTVLTVEREWDTQPDNTSQYIIAYNLADIYAADVAGNWGYVTNPVPYVYIINCDLRGSTQAYLGTRNEFVMFGINCCLVWSGLSAGIFAGQRINSTDPYGYAGSVFFFRQRRYCYRQISSGVLSEWYDSHLKEITDAPLHSTSTGMTLFHAALRTWGCTFENMRSGVTPMGGPSTDFFKRVNSLNGYFGMEGLTTSNITDINIIKTCGIPIIFEKSDTDKQLSNVTVVAGGKSSDIGTWNLDKNAYIDDSSIREVSGDIWGSTGNLGTIWRRFSTMNNLKVVNEAGTAINGATVIVKNVAGTEVINALTEADGKLTTPAKLIYKQYSTPDDTNTTTVTHTPHTLEIRKAGYNSVRNVSFNCLSDSLGDFVLTKSKTLNLSKSVKISN